MVEVKLERVMNCFFLETDSSLMATLFLVVCCSGIGISGPTCFRSGEPVQYSVTSLSVKETQRSGHQKPVFFST
jgi:uncharacterized membrane protein